MNLQLIKGSFSQHEAMDLLTQLVDVKIKFHENKIEKSHNEEDIKMRERRIKQLQQELNDTRQTIMSLTGSNCVLESGINIS